MHVRCSWNWPRNARKGFELKTIVMVGTCSDVLPAGGGAGHNESTVLETLGNSTPSNCVGLLK